MQMSELPAGTILKRFNKTDFHSFSKIPGYKFFSESNGEIVEITDEEYEGRNGIRKYVLGINNRGFIYYILDNTISIREELRLSSKNHDLYSAKIFLELKILDNKKRPFILTHNSSDTLTTKDFTEKYFLLEQIKSRLAEILSSDAITANDVSGQLRAYLIRSLDHAHISLLNVECSYEPYVDPEIKAKLDEIEMIEIEMKAAERLKSAQSKSEINQIKRDYEVEAERKIHSSKLERICIEQGHNTEMLRGTLELTQEKARIEREIEIKRTKITAEIEGAQLEDELKLTKIEGDQKLARKKIEGLMKTYQVYADFDKEISKTSPTKEDPQKKPQEPKYGDLYHTTYSCRIPSTADFESTTTEFGRYFWEQVEQHEQIKQMLKTKTLSSINYTEGYLIRLAEILMLSSIMLELSGKECFQPFTETYCCFGVLKKSSPGTESYSIPLLYPVHRNFLLQKKLNKLKHFCPSYMKSPQHDRVFRLVFTDNSSIWISLSYGFGFWQPKYNLLDFEVRNQIKKTLEVEANHRFTPDETAPLLDLDIPLKSSDKEKSTLITINVWDSKKP